jgi:hypothetical protein
VLVTKVRIFSLDDSAAVDLPPRLRGRGSDDSADAPVVAKRRREDTAVRNHAFLDQTMPPSNPLVLESERRRSGSDGELE